MTSLVLALRRHLETRGWAMIAQYLIAFFFIAASLYKIESFFLDHDQTLRRHFEFWISLNLPPMWYRSLMFWMMGLPHGEQAMEASATLLQFIPAIMLLANYRTRLAGWLLAVIQVNIFLATFYHPNFNEFVGGSLWICLFFILRKNDGTWNKRAWQVLTGLLFVWAAVFVRNRFNAGDPWLSSVPWQRLHLQADVLSITYPWKAMVLWLSGTTVGAILWAGVWWMELAATFLLLTRLRLYGGAALLIFAMLRTLTWMNSITSEGVLATLILFLWVAQEEALQHRSAQEKTIGFTKNTAV